MLVKIVFLYFWRILMKLFFSFCWNLSQQIWSKATLELVTKWLLLKRLFPQNFLLSKTMLIFLAFTSLLNFLQSWSLRPFQVLISVRNSCMSLCGKIVCLKLYEKSSRKEMGHTVSNIISFQTLAKDNISSRFFR